jgi:hypothetical protein
VEALEQDILNWIADHSASVELAAQISAAVVKKRDSMPTGVFLYFAVADDLAAVAQTVKPQCPHIDGADLMDGAGCSLMLKNGYLHYLEIYTRGGFMPEALEHYELREVV